MIYCGPTEWRYERRRGSSIDRKNTVRHLIQMMAITEEGGGTSPIPPQMREDSEEENADEKLPSMSQSLPTQPFCKYFHDLSYNNFLSYRRTGAFHVLHNITPLFNCR